MTCKKQADLAHAELCTWDLADKKTAFTYKHVKPE